MTETLSSESDANQIVEYLLKEVAPKYKKDFEKKREIKLKRKVIKLEKSDKPEEIAVKSSVDVFDRVSKKRNLDLDLKTIINEEKRIKKVDEGPILSTAAEK